MKFLPLLALASASSFINEVDAGETLITGRIEAYSCKRGTDDQKLYHELETQYQADLKSSGDAMSVSPFGPMIQKRSRETLIELISTLNAAFPDYDFRSLKGEHFLKEDPMTVMAQINSMLVGSIPNFGVVKNQIWAALDAEINIRECDIYSFNPDLDSNPFEEEGHVWSFNYFFYNKRSLKRIVLFSCSAQWKNAPEWDDGPVTNHHGSNLASDGYGGMEFQMDFD